MTESILISIKKLLGIDADYRHFDPDIILHINSALAVLTQLGVGPENGFGIADDAATWQDFLGGGDTNFDGVKSYVYLKVRLLFDPPASSAVLDSMNRLINEFEWRINAATEKPAPKTESI